MSRDARNSLIAWGTVLAMFGLFWLGSHFAILPDLPPWVDRVFFALALIGLGWDIVRSIRAERRESVSG